MAYGRFAASLQSGPQHQEGVKGEISEVKRLARVTLGLREMMKCVAVFWGS